MLVRLTQHRSKSTVELPSKTVLLYIFVFSSLTSKQHRLLSSHGRRTLRSVAQYQQHAWVPGNEKLGRRWLYLKVLRLSTKPTVSKRRRAHTHTHLHAEETGSPLPYVKSIACEFIGCFADVSLIGRQMRHGSSSDLGQGDSEAV